MIQTQASPRTLAFNRVSTHYVVQGANDWERLRAECQQQAQTMRDRGKASFADAFLAAVEDEIAFYTEKG